MKQFKIGIFFVVQGHLLVDVAPLEQGEIYGDAINFSGHFDYWEALKPTSAIEQLFKSHAYDHFPRGRVVYFNKTDSFKLYADRCITKVEIEKIAAAFQLPAYQLGRDEHYQCAICNPDYLD
jgi:hypothetical protein